MERLARTRYFWRVAQLVFSSCVLSFIFANSSQAAGMFRIESDGFLRTSEERPNSSNILTLGPEFSGQSRHIEGRFDLRAMAYTSQMSSITLESKNAYIATSHEMLTHNQFTLGRRKYNWSTMDDAWAFGMWSPRFIWDPLRPEQIGLTGAFHEFKTSNWTLTSYASPVAIPERSYPVQNVSGKLSSPSPFFIPPPEKMIVMNQQAVAINYNIKTPNYSAIIFRPNAAFKARYGREEGTWGSLGYGYMPVHQIDLAFQASLNIPSGTLNADIYPRFPMHHLLTAETGYNNRSFSVWASATGEQPTPVERQDSWISNSTGPAFIPAAGASLRWEETLTLASSYLFVLESNRGIDGPPLIKNVNLDLPSRFPYRRALQVSGNWDRGERMAYNGKWTLDADNQSSLFSMDIAFRPKWRPHLYGTEHWTFGVGADFIASNTDKGTIGQYRGDDRVRGGVTYAF